MIGISITATLVVAGTWAHAAKGAEGTLNAGVLASHLSF
jgi:hypothetical protein